MIRDYFTRPIKNAVIFLILLIGTHVFNVNLYPLFSIEAGILMSTGIVSGVFVTHQLDDYNTVALRYIIACIVFGIALAGSWLLADVIVGSSNNSIRILGFAFGMGVGNVAEQIVSKPIKATTETTDRN